MNCKRRPTQTLARCQAAAPRLHQTCSVTSSELKTPAPRALAGTLHLLYSRHRQASKRTPFPFSFLTCRCTGFRRRVAFTSTASPFLQVLGCTRHSHGPSFHRSCPCSPPHDCYATFNRYLYSAVTIIGGAPRCILPIPVLTLLRSLWERSPGSRAPPSRHSVCFSSPIAANLLIRLVSDRAALPAALQNGTQSSVHAGCQTTVLLSLCTLFSPLLVFFGCCGKVWALAMQSRHGL
jgi:hypothetical protein